MFGILLSAANAVLAWTFRAIVIKFVVFTALFLVTTELTEAALDYLGGPMGSGVGVALGNLPDSVLWAFSVFRLDVGIPAVLSAGVVAFAIRRLPVIG